MGGGRPGLVPTPSWCSWDGSSCVSLGRWLALSEPWFPHLQNEHRFGVLAVPPRGCLPPDSGTWERSGEGEGADEVHRREAGEGNQEKGRPRCPASWPGVGQGLLTASLGAFPHAPVRGSNPDPTADSGIWLPSPHWLHSGHVGVSFLLIFHTCPPPSSLSALAVPSPGTFHPRLPDAPTVSRSPSPPPDLSQGLSPPPPPPTCLSSLCAGALTWVRTPVRCRCSRRCSGKSPAV